MPSPKTSGRNAFGALLGRTYRQWRRAADLHLHPFALTEATWLPLVHIARAPAPPRQKDLAASMFVDGSSVVRLLDNLETAGLIQRRAEFRQRVLVEPGGFDFAEAHRAHFSQRPRQILGLLHRDSSQSRTVKPPVSR